MFKYELHCHTSVGSACGTSSPEEQVDFYKSLGYTGIFITDHFFNGNCAVDRSLAWEEKVEIFYSAYEQALKRGKEIGLYVFFGIEFNHKGAEFLVYGLNKEWLLAHPDCDKYSVKEFCNKAHESGAFIAQAHPFREASYLKSINLYPRDVDAIEVLNAANQDLANRMADIYANEYELMKIAGSDNHNAKTKKKLAAVLLYEEASDSHSFTEILKKGNYEIETITL